MVDVVDEERADDDASSYGETESEDATGVAVETGKEDSGAGHVEAAADKAESTGK